MSASLRGSSSQNRWISHTVGSEVYELLDLDHPAVERRILNEMSGGVPVYYDRRWEATEIFGRWILDHPYWVEGKRILVLGAGVGLETVVLGRHCEKLFINDLAPVALELCREQLARNGITDVETLPGRLENLALPNVDLVAACFLVYNRDTRTAIRTFAER